MSDYLFGGNLHDGSFAGIRKLDLNIIDNYFDYERLFFGGYGDYAIYDVLDDIEYLQDKLRSLYYAKSIFIKDGCFSELRDVNKKIRFFEDELKITRKYL
ncbi:MULTISPECIES: hypothetical protein [unclassified Brevundimonas]|uniref:hypothetical protein n=1 Tax=unclassified Brevundimonas TaxID=2622653 RepID=UPI003B587D22